MQPGKAQVACAAKMISSMAHHQDSLESRYATIFQLQEGSEEKKKKKNSRLTFGIEVRLGRIIDILYEQSIVQAIRGSI